MTNGSAVRSVVDIAIEEIGKLPDVENVKPAQSHVVGQQPIRLEVTLFHMSKAFVVNDSGLPYGYSESLSKVLSRLQREYGAVISTVTNYGPAQPLIMQNQRYYF
jgi:hypothetical protein